MSSFKLELISGIIISSIVITLFCVAITVGCANGGYAPGLQPYFVASDFLNNRIFIWFTFPLSTDQGADVVVGQPNMNSVLANQGGSPTAQTLDLPSGVLIYGNQLFVADELNNRVLIWNSIPMNNDQPANVVLGQPDMVSNSANNGNGAVASAQSLSSPVRMCVDASGRFYVSDSGNARILIWNQIPTQNFQAANLVLGHNNFISSAVNDGGGTSNYAFSSHTFPAADNSNFYAADESNNRVLIWSSYPTVSGQAANIVLGQPNMAGNTANNGGESAQTLKGLHGIFSDGQRLAVADNGNERVLIWSSIPTVTQQAANLVIGQTGFNASVAGPTSQLMSGPDAVSILNGNMLIASDQPESRILIWSTFPTTNGQAANLVLGQTNFTSSGAAAGATGLNFPGSLSIGTLPLGISY